MGHSTCVLFTPGLTAHGKGKMQREQTNSADLGILLNSAHESSHAALPRAPPRLSSKFNSSVTPTSTEGNFEICKIHMLSTGLNTELQRKYLNDYSKHNFMRKFFPLMLRKHSISALEGVGAADRFVEAILQDKAKQKPLLPGVFPLCQNTPQIFPIFSEYSIVPYWSPLSASQVFRYV